jgi:hypothetical protein
MPRQRFTPVVVDLAFARAGNTAEALRMVDGIERDFSRDTLVQRYGLRASSYLKHCDATLKWGLDGSAARNGEMNGAKFEERIA